MYEPDTVDEPQGGTSTLDGMGTMTAYLLGRDSYTMDEQYTVWL
jgi:hypothetical protein